MRPDSTIHWSTYPALLLAGVFAVGVGLQRGLGAPAVTPWLVGAGSGAVLFAATDGWSRRRLVTLAPLGRVAAVALVVLCAGGVRSAVYDAAAPRTVAPVAEAQPDRPVSLAGTIADAPERAGAATQFTLSVDSVGLAPPRPAAGRVRVTLEPASEDGSASGPRLVQGDHVRLRGSLRPPPSQRNPGGFDYAAYLDRRGVCCTMYVEAPADVSRVRRGGGRLTEAVVAVRHHIRRQLRRFVPGEEARAVLRALLLGDRSGVSDAQRRRFARTGLMHLLAVSGLHVFLVGMVFYVLLRPLLMRLRLRWRTVEVARAALTMLVLGGYMLITGSRPSVVRAVVMSGLLIGGVVFQRSAHPLNTLGVAALLLLALRPPALFDAGFQLSLAAVAGIVTINPRLLDPIPDAWTESPVGRRLTSICTVSVAATMGTAPVLLSHFGWVSVGGLPLNVAAIPLTGLALSSALALVVFGGVGSVAGTAFGSVAGLCVEGLLLVARYGAEWMGWIGLRLFEPGPWLLGALAAAVVAVAQWPRPRHRWRALLCALALTTIATWSHALGRATTPTMDVLFFDVGQGDAALITTPAERRILVDTGPRSFEGRAALSTAVLPYLRRTGVRHLHTVVVTHPDADHLGGLPPLLRHVSVGRVLHSGQHVDTDLFRQSRRRLRQEGIPHRAVDRGDTLSVDPSLRVDVLGPPAQPGRQGLDTENGRSVVLRLTYGDVRVLLPGDIEAAAERDLVRTFGSTLQSRVVKVPHHGSGSSSTEPFVAAATGSTATRAVVSVGQSGRFGMPDPTVLSRWASADARVRSTAHRGAVWLRTDGRTVWSVDWR